MELEDLSYKAYAPDTVGSDPDMVIKAVWQ